jgi:hypothetical protein
MSGIEYISTETDSRIYAMNQVIKELRLHSLSDGHCFMIFDDELSENQAFYEYPDGSIQIEQLNKTNVDIPRVVIHVLSQSEISKVREKHEVFW